MTNDKGILIRNIYYMLAYAFRILRKQDMGLFDAEQFRDTQDLFAAILAGGISRQLKQGLYREYGTKCETTPVLRGRLDIQGTVRNRIGHRQLPVCEFDEFTEDNLFNRILKTTMHVLIRDENVDETRKDALCQILPFFDGVTLLGPSAIPWKRLHYGRSSRNYEMLLNICRFVLQGMLQTTEKGNYRLAAFSEEHMARLYEKFILEYYRQHYSPFLKADPTWIRWNLTGENDDRMQRLLPAMQTDVTLRLNEKVLIIDAKYYGRTLQRRYDRDTLHSANLYQIFSYVKNQDKKNTGNVAGLLLYAKTEESVMPEDCSFEIGYNRIGAGTLDLNQEFERIAARLDRIATEYFGEDILKHKVC